MKKVILYSLLTVLSVMFYECGKSEEAPGETYTFQFSEEDWAVPVAGANKNVPLEAPGELDCRSRLRFGKRQMAQCDSAEREGRKIPDKPVGR